VNLKKFIKSNGWIFLTITITGCLFVVGCGKKQAQPENQNGGQDSSHTASGIDTTVVPAHLTDSTKINFALRMKVGDMFRYKAIIAKTASGTFDGTPSSEKDESDWYFSLKVSSVNKDSSITVFLQYDSIMYRMSSDQNSVNYSSNDTTTRDDPNYMNWNGLLGLKFPVTISSSGEILDISGVEPVADRIFESRKQDKSKLAPEIPGQVVQEITETEIRAVVGHIFLPFPGKEVSKDSMWTRHSSSMVDAFPANTTITYMFAGFGAGRSAKVNSTMNVAITEHQVGDSTALLSLRNGSVTGTSAAELDIDRGIVKSKDSHITVSLDYSAVGRGKYASGKGKIKKSISSEVIIQML